MACSSFRRHKTFARRRIHPLEHKELTAGLAIRRCRFRRNIVVPLAQHAGAPAVPLVTVGQQVVRGEPIAGADGMCRCPCMRRRPVHRRDRPWPTAEGPKAPAIVIEVFRQPTRQCCTTSLSTYALSVKRSSQAVRPWPGRSRWRGISSHVKLAALPDKVDTYGADQWLRVRALP